MRIAIATVGTTGDVVPFAALAELLGTRGHDVTTISWELHRPLLEPASARFVAAGPETSWDDIRDTAQRAAGAPSPMEQVAVLQGFHLRDAARHYADLRAALAGHDLVLLHGIHSLAEAAARDLDARWATAVFDPVLLPTRSAPPAGMPALGPLNPLGWWLLDRMLRRADAPLRDALSTAGSAAARQVTMFRARSPLLHLVAASPAIVPRPSDLPPSTHLTGAWVRSGPPVPLDGELRAFLDRGERPVVVTFGSMVGGAAPAVSAAVLEAVVGLGARCVLQSGAAGLDAPAKAEDGVLAIGAVEHRSLLPRAAAVLHHGGAGTTHAVAAAGVPSVVVPHVGDQRYWAARLAALGVAPAPIPLPELSAAVLAERLRTAISEPGMRDAAGRLAERVAADHGTTTAADLLERAAADA